MTKRISLGLALVAAVCLVAVSAQASSLSVNANAAMVGSFGLEVNLDTSSQPQAYVIDTSPNAETTYRARFHFDPNSSGIPINGAHGIMAGRDDVAGQAVLRVLVKRRTSTYRVRAMVRQDGGTWSRTNWVTIGDTAREIEVAFSAGTAGSSTDCAISIERLGAGGQIKTNNGDCDTRQIDEVRLGAVLSIDPGSTGSYYFDEFQSFR